MVKDAIGFGDTVSAAKEDACKNLEVDSGDIKFEILELPVKKVLGLFGGKSAKVRAFISVSPAEKAKKYVEEILTNFGISDFKIEILEKEYGAELNISGDKISPIIGRRGELLDSIQYLAGLVANSQEKNYFRLTINAGDYRQRREKALESLGRKIAFKAIKTGKKIRLEPMTTYERKMIHLVIEKIDGVESWSEGEGIDRHILVAPSKSCTETPKSKSFVRV